MTDDELLDACKEGLSIPENNFAFDGTITQKMLAVKSFMLGAGVTEEKMSDPRAVGVIVMGVSDIWELKSGEVKFSPLFYTFVNQLALG